MTSLTNSFSAALLVVGLSATGATITQAEEDRQSSLIVECPRNTFISAQSDANGIKVMCNASSGYDGEPVSSTEVPNYGYTHVEFPTRQKAILTMHPYPNG